MTARLLGGSGEEMEKLLLSERGDWCVGGDECYCCSGVGKERVGQASLTLCQAK